MNAVRNGQSAVVELLLKEGADVDARSKTGQTALKLAADSLRKDVVAVLTDYGAMQQ
jgi:ankyrin repeat protein